MEKEGQGRQPAGGELRGGTELGKRRTERWEVMKARLSLWLSSLDIIAHQRLTVFTGNQNGEGSLGKPP